MSSIAGKVKSGSKIKVLQVLGALADFHVLADLVGHRAAAVYTYLSNLFVCLFELDLALFGRVTWLANVWSSDRYVIECNCGSIDTSRGVTISIGEPTHAISAVLFVIRKCGSFTDLFPSKSHILI